MIWLRAAGASVLLPHTSWERRHNYQASCFVDAVMRRLDQRQIAHTGLVCVTPEKLFRRRQETRNAVLYETVVGKSECKNHRVRAKVPCQPQVDSSTCTQLMGTAVEEGMGKHVPEWTTQALSSCWAAGLKSATKGVQYSSDTCTGTALRPSPQRCENAALTFHWTCYPYHTTCRLLRFPVPRKRFLTIFLWECW